MRHPVPIQHQAPPPAANFNQQMLSSGLSDMNQPVGLTMIQHHLSLLTPKARVALFSQMQGILPPPPPTLPALLVPVIQPNLELLLSMQDLAQRMEGIEKDVLTIKHQNVDEDLATNVDVDAEEENQPCPQWKHTTKKKSKERAYILNVAKARLTAAQLTTRLELQVRIVASALQSTVTKTYQECLHKTIYDLTRLIASEIGSNGSDDTMSDPPKMMFDFQAGASHEANSAIFSQAVDIVWKEQSDKETCSLTHQTVHYTHNDLVAFVKSKFQSYKRKYIEKTDEGRAVKRQKFNIVNKWLRRQEHLAEDRKKAVDDYITRHHIDPSELLQPEYMSDQVSELDTDDEDEKQARKKDIQKAANLLERDVHAGVPVWETIRPAWRSEERKESKQKTALTRRVNLSNNNNAPPSIPIFPFMLDSKWHDSYQAGTPYAPIEMYEQDPQGFKKREGQHDEDLPQGNSEKASENGSTDSHSVNGDGDGDDADDTLDGDS
ncbi:hypothetical protein DFJ58DRAFT_731635 [Suillus subalutaceus]|uniref:uncharacterized protein n=1 Tax=Suillus subalutaceus TaxID=48586 RepID=UPI001B88287B|nr:uncharacterized protein DFJ58DRAFT_731635 [Suillus subalutaceus]KAG1843345.1 hypothetical protein DFJ58DRAFT_731635 [Suillus subalutaceus]